ncbi:MAG: amidohydrolase family protein [Kiritimatiellae bacterium]|nr:amidohydrolase family protein [Kiritimatiellia bacterium]
MFIDIHCHVCRKAGPPRGAGYKLGKPQAAHQAFATPDQLLAIYDHLGVERGVILPVGMVECHNQTQSNEEALEICAQYPQRFIPFCYIDPRAISNSADAPLGDMMQYYKDQGCRGIGEICANLPFLNPMVQNLFRHAEAAGFPLTFHISTRFDHDYGIYDDPGLPQLETSLQRFPKLKFFGHSQPFWAEMAPLDTVAGRAGYPKTPVKEEGALPKLMRKYGNLHGDLSAGSGCNALTRDPEYAVKFLTEFQDRLLFGMDICTPPPASAPCPLIDFLLDLRKQKKISEAVFQKVARENAVRLLGLS